MKIKEGEMVGACGTYEGEEKWIQRFGGEAWEKVTTRKTQTIKVNLTEVGLEGLDWIQLAIDRDSWWTVVNTVVNVSIKCL